MCESNFALSDNAGGGVVASPSQYSCVRARRRFCMHVGWLLLRRYCVRVFVPAVCCCADFLQRRACGIAKGNYVQVGYCSSAIARMLACGLGPPSVDMCGFRRTMSDTYTGEGCCYGLPERTAACGCAFSGW